MLLLILLVSYITYIYSSCGITYPFYNGLTYDLTPFINNNIDYNIQDSRDISTSNYNYIFNICNNVNNIPTLNTTHIPNTGCGSIYAPAYQLSNTNQCFKVGNLSTSTYNLYDIDNPANGIVLTYLNGDMCTYTDSQTKKIATKPRSFGINFLCSDFAVTSPSTKVIEGEFSTCEYLVTFNSAYACPTQCPIVDYKICSTNGVCGFDVDTNKARCFCDTGFEGEACNILTSSNNNGNNSNPTIVLEVFVFIMLAVVLVLGYFVYTKIRTIKPEASDYTNLESIKIPSTDPIIN